VGTEKKIKILVCYYQSRELPNGDIFMPIQAGKAVSGFDLGILGDNTGDNISDKNATFSEFTAWYWAWKNIKKIYPDVEYIGLSHYRRYFVMDKSFLRGPVIYLPKIPAMNNYDDLFIDTLKNHDIILTKQTKFSNDLRTHYSLFHNSFDYLIMKDIVHEISPEYDESFYDIFERNNRISLYCMFVAKYNLFNDYFNWLFPLLFEAERRIDVSRYTQYQKRVLAFLAERLLNVYVYHNNLKVAYRPIYFIDKDNTLKKRVKKALKESIKSFMPFRLERWIKTRRGSKKYN
jgi:hypothetical protein